ncbi:hypothetical protein PIB30_045093 [Stylosanthes scabra]|uniref:Uncharacterized protein n=1 Tax=Stylosanthes scabra TaxID=79078 RepID=A0ABU6YEY6_9FABA|nr:hypothetical protein [Stylosanthes scabra]
MMSYMNYTRVGSGRVISHGRYSSRGFRLLNPRRVLVLRLIRKSRFTFILRLFHRLKLSYCEALHLLRRVFCIIHGGFKRIKSKSSRINLVKSRKEEQVHHCQRYYVRPNNSIYVEEAIADCLEFIKRTSISSSSSVDQSHGGDPISHIQDGRITFVQH